MDRLSLSRDRFIEIEKVTQTLESTLEGDSEVIEMHVLVRVTIGCKTDGLPVSRNCVLKISNITQMLKPIPEGGSEISETVRLRWIAIRYKLISNTEGMQCFLELC